MSHEIPFSLDSKICRYEKSGDPRHCQEETRLNLKIHTWMELFANSDTCTRAKMRDVSIDIARFIHGFDIPISSWGAFMSKFASSAPYHYFLTSVAMNESTSTQQYSVSFHEIIDFTVGVICESLHINFYVDLIWLVSQYMLAAQDPKISVLYQYLHPRCVHHYTRMPFIINIVEIEMPEFGCHHPKISILKYLNNSIRIIISSANLYAEDWTARTQALWISPFLPLLPENAGSDQGESPTNFKKDFIKFLDAYSTPELLGWAALLHRTDCSSINVFLLASVPGYHKGSNLDDWGHKKLAHILSKHVDLLGGAQTWPVVAQSSALGVFGQHENCWLVSHIVKAMSGGKNQESNSFLPEIKIIFPSQRNYQESYDGQRNQTCLMYSSATHARQMWIKKHLHQWKSDNVCRTLAMPHSKCYTRISPDGTGILWFVLTSANLSKGAWGKMMKDGGTQYISNYEAGVVFVPKFMMQSTKFPTREANQMEFHRLLLPYDWPLTPYQADDEPFIV